MPQGIIRVDTILRPALQKVNTHSHKKNSFSDHDDAAPPQTPHFPGKAGFLKWRGPWAYVEPVGCAPPLAPAAKGPCRAKNAAAGHLLASQMPHTARHSPTAHTRAPELGTHLPRGVSWPCGNSPASYTNRARIGHAKRNTPNNSPETHISNRKAIAYSIQPHGHTLRHSAAAAGIDNRHSLAAKPSANDMRHATRFLRRGKYLTTEPYHGAHKSNYSLVSKSRAIRAGRCVRVASPPPPYFPLPLSVESALHYTDSLADRCCGWSRRT